MKSHKTLKTVNEYIKNLYNRDQKLKIKLDLVLYTI